MTQQNASRLWYALIAILVVLGTVGMQQLANRIEDQSRLVWKTRIEQAARKNTDILLYWLEFRRQLLRGLVLSLEHTPDLDKPHFQTIARQLLQDDDGEIQQSLALYERQPNGDWRPLFVDGRDGWLEQEAGHLPQDVLLAMECARQQPVNCTSRAFSLTDERRFMVFALRVGDASAPARVVIAPIDLTSLIDSFIQLQLSSGLDLALGMKTLDQRGVISMVRGATLAQPAFVYREEHDWAGAHWQFEWRVARDFSGGPDLWLSQAVRWGGSLFLTLLASLFLLLFRHAAVLKRENLERQHMGQALTESERRFRTIVSQLPGAVYRAKPQAHRPLDYVSDGIETLSGIKPQAFLNGTLNLSDIVLPDDRVAIEHAQEEALATGQAFASEYRIRDRFGRLRWIMEHGQLTRDEQGQVQWIDGILLDITDRRQAQEALATALAQLQQNNEQLEARVLERTHALKQSHGELQQAMNRLVQSEKLAALGNLVAGIAHELNTPIGNAMTVTSALQPKLENFRADLQDGSLRKSTLNAFLDDTQEAVRLITGNIQRAASLVLSFKQVAIDQTSMRQRDFDLRTVLEETLSTLKPLFKHTPHGYQLEAPPDILMSSYPGALEQVIVNLVQNAVLHGFSNNKAGLVQIKARVTGRFALIEIQDNGCGIPSEVLPHVFEPFFTTRMGSGGSGLGLYIVHNLVTGVLGGRIDAYSTPDQGSRFAIELPLQAPAPKTVST